MSISPRSSGFLLFPRGGGSSGERVTTVVAYEFQCDKTLPEMLQALRNRTGWQWLQRYSDIWDDYLSANVPERDVIVKVFMKVEPFQTPAVEDRGRYVFQLKFTIPEARSRWEQLAGAVLDDLVPLIGATDVQQTAAYQ